MSSAVYVTTDQPITLPDWREFCEANEVSDSPFTREQWQQICEKSGGAFNPEIQPQSLNQTTFYRQRVEISIGSFAETPQTETVNMGTKVTVSTYFMETQGLENLKPVALLALKILSRFGGNFESDPELKSLMENGKFTSAIRSFQEYREAMTRAFDSWEKQ